MSPSPARSRGHAGLSACVSPPARPLVVTQDDDLLDDLLRLAAAAGIEVDVAADPSAARSPWSAAPLVVVGDDQADALSRFAPARRRGVLLVGRRRDDAAVWRHGMALGAEQVLFFPDDEPWLAGRFADAAEGEDGEAVMVGVVGGRGGAGASTMATALAVRAGRRGLAAVLVDLDPLGGGLDLVLGAEGVAGLRWRDLADSKGRLGARALQAELPSRHGLSVLSWDRGDPVTVSPEAAATVLAAARRAADLVVLDLPRWPDLVAADAARSCALVLLVVPAEVRAVAAAARVAAGLAPESHDLRLVVRGPSTAGLGGDDVAAALGLPLEIHMAAEPRLAERLDRGEPPGLDRKGPLGAGCDEVLAGLFSDDQASAA